MKLAVGIDVGGTNIKYGVFTESGSLLEKRLLPTGKSDAGGEALFSAIADETRRIVRVYESRGDTVAGVGIGMPGPVLPDGRIENCVNLHLKDINPSRTLSEMTEGIPVFVGNDANVAALGELWKGGGKGYRSILLVTLGTGVGSGVVLDGEIVSGVKGLAGEIGHIVVNPHEKERCNCGKRGCLDQIASARGLVRTAEKMLKFTEAPSMLRSGTSLCAEKIVNAARAGDALAYIVLDYCMSFLGKCLADASYVLDPQVFVIGGGVSQGGSIITDMVRRHYEKTATLVREKTPIVLAELGNDAGIYGAAKLAFGRTEKTEPIKVTVPDNKEAQRKIGREKRIC